MSSTADLSAQLDHFRNDYDTLRREIGKVIVGQDDIVRGALLSLLAGGHVLLEGVPGLGKTLLVRTMADALNLKFSRIQFTPDLMPADLIGTNIVLEDETGRKRFEFQPGPIFANIVLADEINRATPKTQSALLEAMQEHTVTVAGQTYKLPQPFFVLATQNPLEMEGTYPLPEAQLDRFFCKLLVTFPALAELESILDRTTNIDIPHATPVLDGARICEMQHLARQIPIADDIRRDAVRLILGTHPEDPHATEMTNRFVRYGSSPRGAQAIILASKILAIIDHRYHVAREDLRTVTMSVLRHRLILNFEGQAEGISTDAVLQDVLAKILTT